MSPSEKGDMKKVVVDQKIHGCTHSEHVASNPSPGTGSNSNHTICTKNNEKTMSHFRRMDEAPASSRQARVLQNALRNHESFDVLKAQIEASNADAFEPDLLSGWTFLHFAASSDLPTQHWQWILEHCAPSFKRTALGESVVDVFFKQRLGNLKWQLVGSKFRAKHLVAVLAKRDAAVIQALPTTIPGLLELPWDANITVHSNHVRIARTFLRDLYLLLKSMHGEDTFHWWNELARVGPSIPSIVADWMHLYLDHCGVYPETQALRILCRTKPLAHSPGQIPSLLSMLISDEGVNSIIPETGRLPIVEALASGWSFKGVQDLWKQTTAYKGHWPLFVYAAMAKIDETHVEILALHKRGAFSVYCWHMASDAVRQRFISEARSDYELGRLTSIYECLRASPTTLRGWACSVSL